ncbi:MAG: DNA/RNA nuclease SfsA [Rhodospirillales bacterium]|nr:MAG: DNA/RNA nuclease SfsA [Rhodospirillales bacterium]
MEFPAPLVRGRLRRRYKRFLADVELDGGDAITAHCANPGSMLGLAEPGAEVWLSRNINPKAKLDWRWELVRASGGHLVCINTGHPNRIAEEAIRSGAIAELAGYGSLRREVSYGVRSRVDILLEQPGRPPCYVEVKSVTLRRPEGEQPAAAEFPDAVTKRGARHLKELTEIARTGGRAMMLYLVQRGDCDHFRVAADIDPDYAAAMAEARRGGVEALCYQCEVTSRGIDIGRALPVVPA